MKRCLLIALLLLGVAPIQSAALAQEPLTLELALERSQFPTGETASTEFVLAFRNQLPHPIEIDQPLSLQEVGGFALIFEEAAGERYVAWGSRSWQCPLRYTAPQQLAAKGELHLGFPIGAVARGDRSGARLPDTGEHGDGYLGDLPPGSYQVWAETVQGDFPGESGARKGFAMEVYRSNRVPLTAIADGAPSSSLPRLTRVPAALGDVLSFRGEQWVKTDGLAAYGIAHRGERAERLALGWRARPLSPSSMLRPGGEHNGIRALPIEGGGRHWVSVSDLVRVFGLRAEMGSRGLTLAPAGISAYASAEALIYFLLAALLLRRRPGLAREK